MSARFDKNQEGLVSFESRKKKANCVCSTMNPGESFVCFFCFDSLLPLFYELCMQFHAIPSGKDGPILPTQVADQNSGFALFYFVPGLFQRFNKYCYWATKPTVHSCTRLAALDHIESKAEYNLFQCRIRKSRKRILFFSLRVRHSASK